MHKGKEAVISAWRGLQGTPGSPEWVVLILMAQWLRPWSIRGSGCYLRAKTHLVPRMAMLWRWPGLWVSIAFRAQFSGRPCLPLTDPRYRTHLSSINSGPQPGVILPPRGHLAISGEICDCHSSGGGWWEFLSASSGWRSGMLLNIQQCTQDNPQQQRMVWPWGLIVLKLRNPDIEGLKRVWAPPNIYYGRAKQELSCLMVDSSRPSNNEREVRAPLEGLELSQAERNRHTRVFRAPKSQCWAFSPCSSGGQIALRMSSRATANSLRTMLMFNES